MRKLKGTITSDKMDKTRVVAVTRFKKHAKYGKYIKSTNKYKAHDKNNEYKEGDEVVIEESRPLSREKKWNIVGYAGEEE